MGANTQSEGNGECRESREGERRRDGPVAPLVVDLDGTLHAGDLSWLLFTHAAGRNPFIVPRALFIGLIRGRAAVKDFCGTLCLGGVDGTGVEEQGAAGKGRFSLDRLRWHCDVLAFIRQVRAEGTPLVLATGTPQPWAEACNRHLGGVFDRVLGSDPRTNLIGRAKARALIARYGARGFDYMGNSAQDLHVWPHCRNILIANAPGPVEKQARAIGRPVSHVFTGIGCKNTTLFTNAGSGDRDS